MHKISNDDLENIHRYSDLHRKYGNDYRALNWGSKESQQKRFQVLAEIGISSGDSILDVGCGFGDFYDWLNSYFVNITYSGIDITPTMVEAASRRYPGISFQKCDIFDLPIDRKFDYIVASGIFVYREQDPERYMFETIETMWKLAKKGVAFNSLSCWSENKEENEYYADPLNILSFCKKFTRYIVLRHDYHPGDFTVYMLTKNN